MRFRPNEIRGNWTLEGLNTHTSLHSTESHSSAEALKDRTETQTNQTQFWVFLQLWRGTRPDGRCFRTDNKAASVSQCNTADTAARPAVCSRWRSLRLRARTPAAPTLSKHTMGGGHKARPQQELVNKSYADPGGREGGGLLALKCRGARYERGGQRS